MVVLFSCLVNVLANCDVNFFFLDENNSKMLQGQITGYPTLCDIWSIYSSWFVSRPHCRGDNYDNGHQQLWLRGCEGQWHNLMGRCPARHPRTKDARSKSDQTRSFDMFPRRKLQSEIQLEASKAECPLMYLFNH